VVCNTGTRLVPTINGTMHHFNNVGLYDALFVMQDTESKTLWNHITGEALYGPMVGRTLGPLGNVLQINVKQALALDSNIKVAISDRAYFVNGRQLGTAGIGPARGAVRGRGAAGRGQGARGLNPNATLSEMFVATLGREDTRRPRMDIGLGVWTNTTRRYYPLDRIRERGNALIDHIDGRKVLVYVDPETFAPAALFVNAASARVEKSELRLDNGQIVRSGVLFDARGRRQTAERPQQVFTRWYGYALTFPGTEVFGQ
jgi:hypothetical protein